MVSLAQDTFKSWVITTLKKADQEVVPWANHILQGS